METCNSGGLLQRIVVFITGMPVFPHLPPENEFLQIF